MSMEFEAAFKRLEEILERMQSENPSLDESLKLYEEADKLIQISSKNLAKAEKKIEAIMKNRDNGIEVDQTQQPILTNFEA
ncbi:MAG: exodeoxyribonuclease VII small subunit [Chlamydiae bacterium]|nr:exodeoxyribonuclease VII small subunit [Chlamydiota bacterium]